MSQRKSVFLSYGFLLIFGALGIHRFYLDKPWTGLLWLLTGGLFTVGLIYDFFTLPIQVYFANKQ